MAKITAGTLASSVARTLDNSGAVAPAPSSSPVAVPPAPPAAPAAQTAVSVDGLTIQYRTRRTTKTARMQLVMTPQLSDAIKEKAASLGLSRNEFVVQTMAAVLKVPES